MSVSDDRRSEAFAGWRRLFEALADERPLVAVFEDLHWADEGLLDFVDHLVDWATGVPLLVVCSARPELFERRPGWGGGKPNAATISLAPLSDNDTARLIGSLMGRPVVDAQLQHQLLSRAGGNPLFTEQFVQMQAEQADVAGSALPDSVQGIVSARLDALAPSDKQLLQDAAVIGKVFWPSAVAALAGPSDRSSFDDALHRLERKQFVRRDRQSSIAGETQYAFLHVLLRDVAYGQIPRSTRASKHASAARWIESLGRPDEHAEMLAHHYVSALEFARAAGQDTTALAGHARGAIIEAAERAGNLNAHAAAVRFYRAAFTLSAEASPQDRADLLFGLAMSVWPAGQETRKSSPRPAPHCSPSATAGGQRCSTPNWVGCGGSAATVTDRSSPTSARATSSATRHRPRRRRSCSRRWPGTRCWPAAPTPRWPRRPSRSRTHSASPRCRPTS